jgi:hypothetical protein
MVTVSDSMEEFSYGVFKHHKVFPRPMSTGNISRGSSSTIGLQKTSPIRVRREPGGHGRLPQSAHIRLLRRRQLGADHGPCYEGEAPERVLVYGAVNPRDTRDALEQTKLQTGVVGQTSRSSNVNSKPKSRNDDRDQPLPRQAVVRHQRSFRRGRLSNRNFRERQTK